MIQRLIAFWSNAAARHSLQSLNSNLDCILAVSAPKQKHSFPDVLLDSTGGTVGPSERYQLILHLARLGDYNLYVLDHIS